MNIILTGFMASGKTTVGKVLAKRIGCEFADTDELIEKITKAQIKDIFAKYGEVYFRQLEADIVKQVSSKDKCVIATGGGVPLNRDNIKELRKNGVIVYLSPEFEIIQKRIKSASDTRPLMNSIEGTEKLFKERQKFYDECDYKINITENMTQCDIADLIIKYIEGIDMK